MRLDVIESRAFVLELGGGKNGVSHAP
jgi:hypothetical protein